MNKIQEMIFKLMSKEGGQLTLEEISVKTGIKYTTLYAWFKGYRKPKEYVANLLRKI